MAHSLPLAYLLAAGSQPGPGQASPARGHSRLNGGCVLEGDTEDGLLHIAGHEEQAAAAHLQAAHHPAGGEGRETRAAGEQAGGRFCRSPARCLPRPSSASPPSSPYLLLSGGQ